MVERTGPARTGKPVEISINSRLSASKGTPANLKELKEQLEEKLERLREIVVNNDKCMLLSRELTVSELDDARTVMLLHDLHKVFPGKGFDHYQLPSPLKEADMLASRMARKMDFTRRNFNGKRNRIRYSIATRHAVIHWEPQEEQLLKEVTANSAGELHGKIFRGKQMGVLNESIEKPFTSLKHHLLLATSLAENFMETGKIALKGLVLCVTERKPENRFKMVGKCYEGENWKRRMWMWLDSKYCGEGNAKVNLSFKDSWTNMVGIRLRRIELGNNMRAVDSWTTALTTLEEWK